MYPLPGIALGSQGKFWVCKAPKQTNKVEMTPPTFAALPGSGTAQCHGGCGQHKAGLASMLLTPGAKGSSACFGEQKML